MEEKRQRVNPSKDNFPYKVELHVHLDGAFRISSLFELARKKNIDLAASTLDEFRKQICVYHAKSLYKVLQSFVIFMPIVAYVDCINFVCIQARINLRKDFLWFLSQYVVVFCQYCIILWLTNTLIMIGYMITCRSIKSDYHLKKIK